MRLADSARRIRPAHVPQVGFRKILRWLVRAPSTRWEKTSRLSMQSEMSSHNASGEHSHRGGRSHQGVQWLRGNETTHLTYFLSGSNIPHRCATSEIVVLSPPGRMSPSQEFNSAAVRTSLNVNNLCLLESRVVSS